MTSPSKERLSRFRTAFGAALTEELARHRTTAVSLAKQAGVSISYTSAVMVGRKKASPEWVENICNTMDLSAEERRKLHVAAAEDAGYKIK